MAEQQGLNFDQAAPDEGERDRALRIVRSHAAMLRYEGSGIQVFVATVLETIATKIERPELHP